MKRFYLEDLEAIWYYLDFFLVGIECWKIFEWKDSLYEPIITLNVIKILWEPRYKTFFAMDYTYILPILLFAINDLFIFLTKAFQI